MSDEPKKRSRGLWIWWAIIALLLAYPLSMGPVLRYVHSRSAWDAYYPLVRVCEAWGPIDALKRFYNDLWGVTYNRDPKTGKRTIRWTESTPMPREKRGFKRRHYLGVPPLAGLLRKCSARRKPILYELEFCG